MEVNMVWDVVLDMVLVAAWGRCNIVVMVGVALRVAGAAICGNAGWRHSCSDITYMLGVWDPSMVSLFISL